MKTLFNVVIECEYFGASKEIPYCFPQQNNLYNSLDSAVKALLQSNRCGSYGWVDEWTIDEKDKVTMTRVTNWQGLINDSETRSLSAKDKEDISEVEKLRLE